LRYTVAGKPFVLDTDASQFTIGPVLIQVTDGIETLVSYFSKALSKPERNYSVTRKEVLAVVLATKHFHKYLYGQRFLLRTEHCRRMEDKQIVTDVRLISVEPEPGWTNEELRKEQLEDDDI
jgi:hypothetical protein